MINVVEDHAAHSYSDGKRNSNIYIGIYIYAYDTSQVQGGTYLVRPIALAFGFLVTLGGA